MSPLTPELPGILLCTAPEENHRVWGRRGQRAGTQHLPSICGLGEIEDRVKQRLDRTWNSHASGPSSAAAAYVEFCRRPVLLAAMPCLPEACFYFASLQAEPSWDSPAGWVIAGALLVTFIVVCFHFVLELNSNARKALRELAEVLGTGLSQFSATMSMSIQNIGLWLGSFTLISFSYISHVMQT